MRASERQTAVLVDAAGQLDVPEECIEAEVVDTPQPSGDYERRAERDCDDRPGDEGPERANDIASGVRISGCGDPLLWIDKRRRRRPDESGRPSAPAQEGLRQDALYVHAELSADRVRQARGPEARGADVPDAGRGKAVAGAASIVIDRRI